MAFLTGALIAAGLSALAGITGTGISHIERARDRAHDKEMTQIAYENQQAINEQEHRFQEDMRDTAISSQVQQLEDAGVNTAAYFANGGSASGVATPSAGSGTGSASNTASAHTQIAPIINSVANVAGAFNNDKDSTNNINLKQALGMISNVASIFK